MSLDRRSNAEMENRQMGTDRYVSSLHWQVADKERKAPDRWTSSQETRSRCNNLQPEKVANI